MRIPSATYRVQFNLNFRFRDAEALVPYLFDLGISHLYASPRFRARKGSSHGYDVADNLRVNSELGTEEEYDQMVEKLRQYNMALLLDIVPNHMAASSENRWWMELLEDGPASRYASYFDIDWSPHGPKIAELQKNRVLVPILADRYDRILSDQQIMLRVDDNGFFVQYEDHRFPINLQSYPLILESWIDRLRASGGNQAASQQIENLMANPDTFSSLNGGNGGESAKGEIKREIWQLFQSDPTVREALEDTLREFNGVKDDHDSFERLDSLLSRQVYRLADWHVAAREINYRRFFDINDLIGMRTEDPLVFAAKHAPILKLVAADKVMGLRVDHIDGLWDPFEYLQRVQGARAASENEDSDTLNIYVVVEKITCGRETIPPEWPTAGTTGYDFLNAVNTLFIDEKGYKNLEASYREFAGCDTSFAEIWYSSKKEMIGDLFTADLRLLAYRLGRLAAVDPAARDLPMNEIVSCLTEITACLPIYRTYIRDDSVSPRDRAWLEEAIQSAYARMPETTLREPVFEFLKRVLFGLPPFHASEHKEAWLSFVMRWQQFTSAVMAKGFEDTSFFVYHPLLSMNEVGCDPFRDEVEFGADALHRFNQRTLGEHPYGLTATSTHDTKWGEDVRARINVLSEMPREWQECLTSWSKCNNRKRAIVNGQPVPTPNEEQLLYQQMLGIWPAEIAGLDEIKSRLEIVFLKAAKEAKTHTSWTSPNEEHESALREFLAAILKNSEDNCFLSSFTNFQQKIAFYGAWNSLSQLLVKIASPGTPDFFQGNEIWNFRLTDPDNRYAVDYSKPVKMLDGLKARKQGAQPAIDEMLQNWRDDRVKLFLTMSALNFRKSQRSLFLKGDYIPLCSTGDKAESIFAFARHFEGIWALAIVPRLLTRVVEPGTLPIGSVWRQTSLALPNEAPGDWVDLFTSESISSFDGGDDEKLVRISDVFRRLPFALLTHVPAKDATRIGELAAG